MIEAVLVAVWIACVSVAWSITGTCAAAAHSDAPSIANANANLFSPFDTETPIRLEKSNFRLPSAYGPTSRPLAGA